MVIVLSTLFSLFVLPVSAESDSANHDSQPPSIPFFDTDIDEFGDFLESLSEDELEAFEGNLRSEQYVSRIRNAYINNLSDEQRQQLEEKELERQAIEQQIKEQNLLTNPDSKQLTRAHQLIELPGTFTVFSQQNSIFCVPASIQSALHYINGESPSQLSIFIHTSTLFECIDIYMNDHQDRNVYTVENNQFDNIPSYLTKSFISSAILYDINHEVPPFLGIVATQQGQWRYLTSDNGHCLLSNAIFNDYLAIQFADPASNSNNSIPSYYFESPTRLFNVCINIAW